MKRYVLSKERGNYKGLKELFRFWLKVKVERVR